MNSIRQNVTWHAIIIAGLAAGTVFIITNIVLTPIVLEIEPGVILNYFASLALGSEVLLDDNAQTLAVGVAVNYGLALLFTFVIALVIHRWGLLIGIVGGAGLGLALYGINLYTMTLFFEWFFAINSSVLLLSHVLFGLTAGGIYEIFDHYDVPFGGGEVSHATN